MWAGEWVRSKAEQKTPTYLSMCALESTERKEKSLCRSTAIVHVREDERDAFSYSCLSASVAHSSETS